MISKEQARALYKIERPFKSKFTDEQWVIAFFRKISKLEVLLSHVDYTGDVGEANYRELRRVMVHPKEWETTDCAGANPHHVFLTVTEDDIKDA